MEKRTKESKKRLNSLILLIAFTAIMLIASTYAWFTTQKNVDIENLRGVVEVAEGLEISLDAKSWSQKINLGDVAAVDNSGGNETLLSILDNAYSNIGESITHKNIDPIELLPVSTIGEFTSDRVDMMRGELAEGKLDKIKKVDEKKEEYQRATKSAEISDKNQAYANLDYPSFIAFDLFVKNTSRVVKPDGDTLQIDKDSEVNVLDSAIVSNDENGYNKNGKYYIGDANSGLQNCVRVGFALYEDTVAPTASQETAITNLVGASDGKSISSVAIWEPNANAHVEYIVNSNNKVTTGEENGSLTPGSMTKTSKFFTFGLKNTASEAIQESELYKWPDEGANDALAIQNTVQTDSGKVGVATNLIKAVDKNEFKIQANKISRVRVYVWLEGQDPDCINFASFGGGIELDLGLTKADNT